MKSIISAGCNDFFGVDGPTQFSERAIQRGYKENDLIMGIAHKNKKIFGLQFHPESIGTNQGKSILTNFLEIINYDL